MGVAEHFRTLAASLDLVLETEVNAMVVPSRHHEETHTVIKEKLYRPLERKSFFTGIHLGCTQGWNSKLSKNLRCARGVNTMLTKVHQVTRGLQNVVDDFIPIGNIAIQKVVPNEPVEFTPDNHLVLMHFAIPCLAPPIPSTDDGMWFDTGNEGDFGAVQIGPFHEHIAAIQLADPVAISHRTKHHNIALAKGTSAHGLLFSSDEPWLFTSLGGRADSEQFTLFQKAFVSDKCSHGCKA